MQIRFLKYLVPFIFFAGALRSFNTHGWVVWIPMGIAWILIPLLELMIRPDPSNLNQAEEELSRSNRIYDWLLYLVVIFGNDIHVYTDADFETNYWVPVQKNVNSAVGFYLNNIKSKRTDLSLQTTVVLCHDGQFQLSDI